MCSALVVDGQLRYGVGADVTPHHVATFVPPHVADNASPASYYLSHRSLPSHHSEQRERQHREQHREQQNHRVYHTVVLLTLTSIDCTYVVLTVQQAGPGSTRSTARQPHAGQKLPKMSVVNVTLLSGSHVELTDDVPLVL